MMDFQDQFITVPDVYGNSIRARYRDTQTDKPLVLFLHGIGSAMELGDLSYPAFAAHFRVIAVDFPGHGQTELCPDTRIYSYDGFTVFVRQFIHAMALPTPFYLVAHSLSGIPATRLALENPDYIKRMVLISPAGYGKDIALKYRLASQPVIGDVAFAPIVVSVVGEFSKARLPKSELVSPEFIDKLTGYIKKTRAKGILYCLRNGVRLDGLTEPFIPEQLQRINIPVLAFWGERDSTVPAYHHEMLLENIADSRVVIFKGRKHRSHVVRVDEFNAMAIEFLKTGTYPDVVQTQRSVEI